MGGVEDQWWRMQSCKAAKHRDAVFDRDDVGREKGTARLSEKMMRRWIWKVGGWVILEGRNDGSAPLAGPAESVGQTYSKMSPQSRNIRSRYLLDYGAYSLKSELILWNIFGSLELLVALIKTHFSDIKVLKIRTTFLMVGSTSTFNATLKVCS